MSLYFFDVTDDGDESRSPDKRLNAFAMNCVAHRPDRAIDRKTQIFCRSPRFQARTLRIRANYKFPFP
jgi:hypothetical protein